MKQLETIAAKRAVLLEEYQDVVAATDEARGKVVQNLDNYIAQAQETLKGKGTIVYHAKDAEEARKLILELCADKQKLVRYSNPELDEIDFDGLMAEAGKEVALTDVGEIVVKQTGKTGNKHPQLANLEGLSQADIVKALQDYVGEAIENPQELNRAVHKKIRENVLSSDYGVTNVQGIIAENGSIVIGESEGNGRTVSNLPYRHIVVAGYDRLYESAEETMRGIQTAGIYGLGKRNPTYYSLISGQSRTADIEFQMAYGVHGPLEVHLILLDNGRRALMEKGCGNLLKCIDCGACYKSLNALAEQNGWTDTLMTAKYIGIQAVNGNLKAENGLDTLEAFSCPVGITAEDVKKAF
ncbi:MAG: lactate utilization protein [Peptococcaceae bacterium]|nr:lactate utilization protein [Peptococcaceae bacterium]